MRTRNVLGAAIVLLVCLCPLARAEIGPGEAELIVYLIDSDPYMAGDIVLAAEGTFEEEDETGLGPGWDANPDFPPNPPPYLWNPDPAATWLSGYSLYSPGYQMSLIKDASIAPWTGGSFLQNQAWEVTFGATGENMMQVLPGRNEWVLGTKWKLDTKQDPDYLFDYGRFGQDLQSRDIIYVVPEPGTILLLVSGLASLFLFWRRRTA